MVAASLVELDEPIAIARDNIRELTERAAALSAPETRHESQTVSPTRSGNLPNSSRNVRPFSNKVGRE
jgi:hypothetical protein